LRRASSLVVLIALGLLALPTTALGARTAGSDSEAIVVVSGDVTVPRGETVDGIVVVSGDVHLAGRSEGDVVLVSGDAVVSGRIEGDLVTIAGRAHLLPRAYVSGDVIYSDEKPLVSGAAVVRGDIKKESWPGSLGFLPFIGAFLFWLAIGISAAILGALLLLIAPRAADAIYARSLERVGPVMAIGIAIAICLPVAAVIAAVTLVGLPLAIGVALALLPLGAVAYVASAWALGRRIVKEPRGRIVAFLAGLAILRLAALIPVLGLIVGLAASVYGLGLIGAAIGAARAPLQPAPTQSPGN
jgi:cytoskeletal protein CcmA (bactofilin family)